MADNAFLGIVTVGMIFVILSGDIDPSVVLRDTTLHPLLVFALVQVICAGLCACRFGPACFIDWGRGGDRYRS